MRETRIVLLATKSFRFQSGQRRYRDKMRKYRGCALGDLEKRVDKGRDNGSLRKHNESAKNSHHNKYRQEPIFFSDSKKLYELSKKQHG